MAVERLEARLRKEDTLLKEYFSNFKKADRAYEIRRLLEKAIKIERKEKEILEKAKKELEQDAE